MLNYLIISLIALFYTTHTLAETLTCDQAISVARNIISDVNKWNQGEGQDVPYTELENFTMECHGHTDWQNETQERRSAIYNASSFEMQFRNLRRKLIKSKQVTSALGERECAIRDDVRQVNHEFVQTLRLTAKVIHDFGVKLAKEKLQLRDREFAEASHTAIAGAVLGNGQCVLYGGECSELESLIRDMKIRQLDWYFDEIKLGHNYLISPQVLEMLVREAELWGITKYDMSDIGKAWAFNVSSNFDGRKIAIGADKDSFSYTTNFESDFRYYLVPKQSEEDPGFRFLKNEEELNIFTQTAQGCGKSGNCTDLTLNTVSFQTMINLKPNFCQKVNQGWCMPVQNFRRIFRGERKRSGKFLIAVRILFTSKK